MADNFDIKDFTLTTAKTIRATDKSGKMVPHHIIENVGTGSYETVAASATDQALGATGATGDVLLGVLVIPETTAPGTISLKDGSTSLGNIFTGGGTLPSMIPFFIPLNMVSVSGAWKLTTGTNVHCIGVGSFT